MLSLIAPILTVLLLVILVAVFVIDLKTQTIPDGWWMALALLGVVRVSAGYAGFLGDPMPVTLPDSFFGAFAASIPLFALASANGGFGGGDIKLMFGAGIFLGWQPVLLALFIGTILAAVIGVFLLVLGKATRKTKIAFGPYLAIGIAVSACIGQPLISRMLALS